MPGYVCRIDASRVSTEHRGMHHQACYRLFRLHISHEHLVWKVNATITDQWQVATGNWLTELGFVHRCRGFMLNQPGLDGQSDSGRLVLCSMSSGCFSGAQFARHRLTFAPFRDCRRGAALQARCSRGNMQQDRQQVRGRCYSALLTGYNLLCWTVRLKAGIHAETHPQAGA